LQKLFSRKLKVVLILAVALALLVAITAVLLPNAGAASNAAGTVLSPLRSAFSSLTDRIEQLYDYTQKYDLIVAENDSLKRRISNMESQIRDTEQLERENARLRELLDLAEAHEDFTYTPAYVSAWDGSNWSSSFTINKGSNQGIDVGMCAITEYGQLVGLVTDVGYSWATVTTILDTASEIGASVATSGYTGVVQGVYQLSGQGELRMSYISTDAVLTNGDQVITTGSGDSYPKGLVLGYISDVGVDETGVAKYAVLDTAADFSALEQIFIITEFDVEE
jgi:rod shape-determining protein MreC